MATTIKYVLGSQTSLLTTTLNALADNSLKLGSAFNNTVGSTGDGYTVCDLELFVTFSTAVGYNAACSFWFIGTQDATNYEDGSDSVTPARVPDVIFPLILGATAHRVIRRTCLPWGLFKPLLKNDNTTSAFTASGHTLKVRPVTYQNV